MINDKERCHIKAKPKTTDMRRHENDDPALEQAFLLVKLADFFPFPICRATAWRYQSVGVRGVKLKAMLVGGFRVCTVEWVDDFLKQLNEGKRNVAGRTPSARARAQRAAAAALDAAGL